MCMFWEWDATHAYYTSEYNSNNVSIATLSKVFFCKQCSPSGDQTLATAPVTQNSTKMSRAQSAPPLLSTVPDQVHAIPPLASLVQPPTHPSQVASVAPAPMPLIEWGTPTHLYHVLSNWPMPILPWRPVNCGTNAQVTSQCEPAHPGDTPLTAQQTLETILEAMDNMSQPHFNRTGWLITHSVVLVPSSPEENILVPVREPQPFLFIPDNEYYLYLSQTSYPGSPTKTPLKSVRPSPASAVCHRQDEGILETPLVQTPAWQKVFVNLFPHDPDTHSPDNNRTPSGSDGEMEDWAALMFKDCMPSFQSKAGHESPTATPTKKALKKWGSPSSTAASKPTKVQKTVSKKTQAASAPVLNMGYTSDSMYLDDPLW